MGKTSTYGLRLDQMASIFCMATKEPNPADEESDNEQMTELLHEQLTRTLPRHSLLVEAMLMMLEQEGYDTRTLAGKSVGQLFLDAASDTSLLQIIKECTKRLSCELKSEAEAALATTLYYSAIAAALVHRGTKITKSSYEKLQESFGMLIEKKWMAEELRGLFSHAQRICENERGTQ